jgi:hypothetical protein
MRTIVASLVASTMLVSSTFAATQSVPLPAGKPAGVKQAAYLGDNFLLILLGAGIVIGGIALAVSNPGGDNPTTPTTSSTTTTSTTTTSTTTTSTGTSS